MKYKVTYKNKQHIINANSAQEAKESVKLLDAFGTIIPKKELQAVVDQHNRAIGKYFSVGFAVSYKPIPIEFSIYYEQTVALETKSDIRQAQRELNTAVQIYEKLSGMYQGNYVN